MSRVNLIFLIQLNQNIYLIHFINPIYSYQQQLCNTDYFNGYIKKSEDLKN